MSIKFCSLLEGIINPIFVDNKQILDFDKKIGKGNNQELEKELENIYDQIEDSLKQSLTEFRNVVKRELRNYRNPKFLTQIKTLESIKDKAIRRKKGLSEINDLVRGAILLETREDVDSFVKNFMRRNKSIIVDYEKKEKGGDPEYGYFGSHHFDLDVNGYIVELQVMTRKLWSYKEAAHEIYVRTRTKGDKTPFDISLSKKLFSMGNVDKKLKEDLTFDEESPIM